MNKDFDSRRDAKLRTYKYKILNRIASPAILENRIWHISKILNFEQMYKASKLFLGSHDFTTFRASSCTATSPHRLDEAFRSKDRNLCAPPAPACGLYLESIEY